MRTPMSSSLLGRTAAVALLVALPGCATAVPGNNADKNGIDVVSQPEPDHMDPIAKAAFWGTRYDRDPSNVEAAVTFSRALRAVDNNDEALRVMRQISARTEANADVMLELGKTLIANDRAHEAIRPIEQSIANGKYEDWSAFSAYGVALDLIGEHQSARVQYDKALELAPNKAKILNNKGLSFALSGRHQFAEATLRDATSGGGTARIRQNYALILALHGKTGEAERLARSDLPPRVADGNVRYFQQLVAAPAYWGELDRNDLEMPDFGDDPETISLAPRGTPVPEPTPSPTPGLIKRNQPKTDPSAPGVAPFEAPTQQDKQKSDTDGVSASAQGVSTNSVIVADAGSAPTALEFDKD